MQNFINHYQFQKWNRLIWVPHFQNCNHEALTLVTFASPVSWEGKKTELPGVNFLLVVHILWYRKCLFDKQIVLESVPISIHPITHLWKDNINDIWSNKKREVLHVHNIFIIFLQQILNGMLLSVLIWTYH